MDFHYFLFQSHFLKTANPRPSCLMRSGLLIRYGTRRRSASRVSKLTALAIQISLMICISSTLSVSEWKRL